MKKKAESIERMHVKKALKVKLLKELLLDCLNEMEAQDQNMHPEVQHNVEEGYRIASNFLRLLTAKSIH
ncbi:MAG: hypothetical protein A3F18_01395 [Legionellales bacterium RIFCSPHIGHO2_12_FULL_37_14]|nr:MAG: hypothetical protein A3F18_01395 [Legionellales bacterium RIFCSPHIGHO2_12_FULL_37_14]